jgi:hypothetical protein
MLSICAKPLMTGVVLLALLAPAAAQTNPIAIVTTRGKLQAGVGIVSTKRIGDAGQYEVTTNRNITKCACLVTRGSPTLTESRRGYATCHQRAGSDGKGFHILLQDEEGFGEVGPFMLFAACTD